MKLIPLSAKANSTHILQNGKVVGFKSTVTIEIEIHDLKQEFLETPLESVNTIVAGAYAENTNQI